MPREYPRDRPREGPREKRPPRDGPGDMPRESPPPRDPIGDASSDMGDRGGDDAGPDIEIEYITAKLVLGGEDEKVLQQLYSGHLYQRIEVTKLHGGFSGSIVLQVQGFTLDETPQEPVVVKLDGTQEANEEQDKMNLICPYLGENTVSVIAEATAGSRGGLVIQLAGACWQLPDLMHTKQKKPVITFQELFAQECKAAVKFAIAKTGEKQATAVALRFSTRSVLDEVFGEMVLVLCRNVLIYFERDLQKQFDFTRWPALAFFVNGDYRGNMTGIQNWDDYTSRIPELLSDTPTIIPLINLQETRA